MRISTWSDSAARSLQSLLLLVDIARTTGDAFIALA